MRQIITSDQCRHNLTCTYISQSHVVAASDSVATLASWLIYKFSDTIEQRMIPQYLASRMALLCAFMHSLVLYRLAKEWLQSGSHSCVPN